MSELPVALLGILLDWSIRFGMLILGLWIWFWLRPPASVYTRLFLGHLVLFAGLALPMTPRWWSLPWPVRVEADGLRVPRGVLPAEESAQAESKGAPSRTMIAPIPSRSVETPQGEDKQPVSLLAQTLHLESPQPENPHPQPSHTTILSWTVILLGAWALGAGFFLLRIAAGFWWLGRIKRNAQFPSHQLLEEWEEARKELKVSRQVPLCNSPWVATPTLLGGWNPMVAIPLDWECEPPENRRAGFLHEWAHIQHRDDWAKLRDELVRALFFFHPLVHWLLNQLGLDRELRCDVLATRHGVNERNLAQFLLAQVKKLGSGQTALLGGPALSFLQIRSAKVRILKLLEADMKRWSERVPRFQGTLLAFLIMGLAFGLGGLGQVSPATSVPAPAPIPGNLGTVEVTGTVLLPNGKPAEGATVWAATTETVFPFRPMVTTNPKGEFRLTLPKGEWSIWASKGTLGGEADLGPGATKRFGIVPPKSPPPISISLEERSMVRSRLVDADSGKPVPNARIHLNNGFATTTNAEGKWEAGGLEWKVQTMAVTAQGFRPNWFHFDTTGKSISTLDLELKPGYAIVGKVNDEKGNPIPGSWVGTSISEGVYSDQGGYIPCAENGEFVYTWGKGKLSLTAWAPGYATQEKSVGPLEPGKERRVAFQLKKASEEASLEPDPDKGIPPKRMVSGKVTLPDGKPAVGVYLRWGIENFTNSVFASTDQNGSFKIAVPEEENHLVLIPKGFHHETIKVAKEGNQSLEIPLRFGQTISGVVTDTSGNPLSHVSLIPTYPFPLDENSAKTDQKGRFELRGMPDRVKLYIYKNGYMELRDYTMNGNQPEPTIQLQRMGVIKGKVVDYEGKPVKNFRVTLNSPKNPDPKDASRTGIRASYTGHGISFSSEDGAFMVSDLKPGTAWRVQVYANGLGNAVEDRVVAVPVESLEKTPPTLITGEKPLSLKFRIRSGDENGIPEAKVTLVNGRPDLDKRFEWSNYNGNWEAKVMERSDKTGLVHFPNLAFKEATVLIEAPGYARQKFGWRKEEAFFSITMVKEAILIGAVKIPNDWKDRDWYYRIVSNNGDSISSDIDPKTKGVFIVRELPEGNWTLEVGPLATSAERATGIRPPPTLTQTIELKAGQLKEWKGEWKP